MVWKIGETRIVGLNVFCPGNFVSVSIMGIEDLPEDYEITNKNEFIDKFFDVSRMPMLTRGGIVYDSPFAMPEVKPKTFVSANQELGNIPFELEGRCFYVKRLSKKKFEIDLSKVAKINVSYEEEKV